MHMWHRATCSLDFAHNKQHTGLSCPQHSDRLNHEDEHIRRCKTAKYAPSLLAPPSRALMTQKWHATAVPLPYNMLYGRTCLHFNSRAAR
jgi:hypothetical protein